MKLSFSLPSKSSSKPNPIKPSTTFETSTAAQNGAASKQFLKEFDASKPLPAGPVAPVIAPIENEWRPHKKMRNLELPITEPGGQSLQFEIDSLSNAEPESNVGYGLNLRSQAEKDISSSSGGVERMRSGGVEETVLQKYKKDMERLSDHKGMEEFEGMPVEGYGAALLAGYGWFPGRGIGKNAMEDVKVKEYTKSTDRHGLGFHKNPKGTEKKISKERGHLGKEVRIVSGENCVGLRGRIVERLRDGNVVLKVSKRGGDEEKEVVVSSVGIADLGSKEEEKCLRRLKEKEAKLGGRRDDERGASSWLARHIRVRVISKTLKSGKLYLKKGEVVDVVGPNTCDISMDGTRDFVQGVSQDFLETALPRRGGPVLVLSGKHKGVFGSLVEKDSNQETGVVKDADTKVMINVRLEQIAEFTGDPSILGY